MRIGIVSIYSFRPHVDVLVFLANMLKEAGHEVYFLCCDSAVPTCYSILLKRGSKLKDCASCIVGGFRSYPVKNVTGMEANLRTSLDDNVLKTITCSTSYTLCRTETAADLQCEEVLAIQRKLRPSVERAYANAEKWITENQLEGVLCFNGRLDLCRAIVQACLDKKVPCISTESPIYGHGIEMFPNETCQAINFYDRMIDEYINLPLTKEQALYAAKLIASRFLRQNIYEWRVYNAGATGISWPVNTTSPKVLILPSSQNEIEGHPDWTYEWNEYTQAIDLILQRLKIPYSSCVLRSHPSWTEPVGGVTGIRSEGYYEEWAIKRGVTLIASKDKADTYSLIQEADLILLSGGSPGVEGAVCGKKVIQYGNSVYRRAGFTYRISRPEEIEQLPDIFSNHNEDDMIRRVLRFIYIQSKRYPQFVNSIRAISVSQRQFFEGADPTRITDAFATGCLRADDNSYADNYDGENEIVALLKSKNWTDIASLPDEKHQGKQVHVRRKFGLRMVNQIRQLFPLGDRL